MYVLSLSAENCTWHDEVLAQIYLIIRFYILIKSLIYNFNTHYFHLNARIFSINLNILQYLNEKYSILYCFWAKIYILLNIVEVYGILIALMTFWE